MISTTVAQTRTEEKTQRLAHILKKGQDDVLTVPMEEEPVGANVISDERIVLFMTKFQKLFEMEREECLSEEKVKKHLNMAPSGFTKSEISSGLNRLEADGKIMVTEGSVFLI